MANIVYYEDIQLVDGVKGFFGTGEDLEIYHDGTESSYIKVTAGDLYIRSEADDQQIYIQGDNGSGGVANYLTIDGNLGYTLVGKDIRFNDSIKARFGTGLDSYIQHTGTNTEIINATGNLNIKSTATDGDITFYADDGAGGTTTYFYLDGSLVNGTSVLGATRFPDKSKIYMGTGGDLEIFHDGSQSGIENYTGNLEITQHANDGDLVFKSDDGSGGVANYIVMAGAETLTSFQKNTRHNDNVKANFGTGSDLQIDFDGTNGQIQQTAGDLYITNSANDKDIIFQSDDGSGGTTEYFRLDGGTVKSIFEKPAQFTDNTKLYLGSSNDLEIYHDGSNSYITNATADLYIQSFGDDVVIQGADDVDIKVQGGEMAAKFGGNGGVDLYHNNVKKFETSNTGVSVTGALGVTNIDMTGILDISATYPRINLNDTNHEDDWSIINADGSFTIYNVDDALDALHISAANYATFAGGISATNTSFNGTMNISSGIYHIGDTDTFFGFVSGNDTFGLTTGGGSRMDANNAGVRFGGGGTRITTILDEDNMASNSNTALATQQSIKAYVDSSTTGVLTYQGTWNASTNSPSLSSGSGTPGYYYIVSVAGSTNLDGITDWAVGDWAVFSDQATDAWQKIDNTAVGNISGSGVSSRVTYWNGTGSVTSTSGFTFDGSNLAIPGYLTISGNQLVSPSNFTIDVGGDITLDADGSDILLSDGGTVFGKFASDSNNLNIFSQQQDKDIVLRGNDGGSGITALRLDMSDAGWAHFNTGIAVGNASATSTFAGNVTMSSAGSPTLTITDTSQTTTLKAFAQDSNAHIGTWSNHDFIINTNSTAALTFDASDSNAAEFAGRVYVPEYIAHVGDPNTLFGFSGADTYIVNTAGTTALTIDSSQDATFAGDIVTTNNSGVIQTPRISMEADGTLDWGAARDYGTLTFDTGKIMIRALSGKAMELQTNGATTALTLDTSQNATFSNRIDVASGDVNIQGGALSITADGSNKVTFVESGNGLLTIDANDDIVLDSGSDIILDAAGDDIRLRDTGTEFGRFNNSSSNLNIYSSIQDKDILFWGNDAGSSITALTLDMSSGGTATFNNELYIPNYIYHVGDANTYFGFNGSDDFRIYAGNTLKMIADSTRVRLYYNGSEKFSTTSTGIEITGGLTTSASSSIAGAQFTSNTSRNDNLKSIYGTDGDIEIYSNNTTAFMEITNVTNFVIGDSTQFNTANIAIARVGAQTGFKSMEEDWFGVYSDADTGKTYLTTSGTEKLRTDTNGIVVTGNIDLNGDSNIVLDTSVSSTQSSGTIIKIGSHMSALVAGNIYYAGNSMGNLYWYGADADSSSTENMLALSVGTDADVDGMLLNGIYHKASHGLTVGEPIYLSTTSMAMTNTAPSGSGDYVRVLGYALDSNHIYFCPDNTWVKID